MNVAALGAVAGCVAAGYLTAEILELVDSRRVKTSTVRSSDPVGELAGQVASATPLPEVVAVVIDGQEFEFLIEPAMDTRASQSSAAREVLPALVPVVELDGGGTVWIDLECAGVVTVDGPDAARFVESIMQALNDNATGGVNHRLVASLDELDDAIDEATSRTSTIRDELERDHAPTTVALRARHPGRVPPLMIAVPFPVAVQSLDAVRRLIADRRGGVAVVAVTEGQVGGWHVHADGDRTHVEPIDVIGMPLWSALPPDELEVVVQTKDDHNEQSPSSLVVRVLGPVAIAGRYRTSVPRKAMEAIAFLGCHQRGVTPGRLSTALWPDRAMSSRTFDNLIWQVRQHLGTIDDGEPLLPRSRGGLYQLAPGSTLTDVDIIEDALRRDVADVRSALNNALTSVYGLPFDEPDGYEWAHAEGLVGHAQMVVADAAERLARFALDANDPVEAEWAARQGLLAAPFEQRLYRQLLRAAHMRSGRSGVDRVVAEICAALEEPDPRLALEPETMTLVNEMRNLAPVRS